MRYEVRFQGRKAGALGITYPCRVFVEAESADEARLRAYDAHEHISNVQVRELPPDPPEGAQ